MQLLIVEDDDAVATALADAVRSAGHEATRAACGADALLGHHNAQMILLDLGLPDVDGLEVLRKLRSVTDVPLIVLTARSDERSVVRALHSGADDYLVKPVTLAVLLARIEAVARRAGAESKPSVVTLGRLRVDEARREAEFDGRDLQLTAMEFDLLALLAAHAGSVVRREVILDRLWGDAFVAVSRSLDVHLSGLRAKLDCPGLIVNVRGVGYRLEIE